MYYIDDGKYLGNYELLYYPIISFLAADDTPEEDWPKVESWLKNRIYGTNNAILSHFETPFEKRVLELLLEHNHPTILFTYSTVSKASFRKLKASRTNTNALVLRYRPAQNSSPSKHNEMCRMAIVNLADECVTIGATADSNISTTLDLYQQPHDKPRREL